jgi:hypothetical protein
MTILSDFAHRASPPRAPGVNLCHVCPADRLDYCEERMIDMTSKRIAERRLKPFDLVGVGLDVGNGRSSVE